MTFEELEAHVGCLIHIKTELYWHNGGWDKISERFCILLAVGDSPPQPAPVARAWSLDWKNDVQIDHHLQLLIDCKPQWVTLNAETFEVIK